MRVLTATSSSPAGQGPSLGSGPHTAQSSLRGALAYLDRHRYLALSALLFALMLSRTLNGQWGGDFSEHAAAVRELARAPFDPGHPLFALDEPHLDFAPYQLALGLFSKLTGIGAVSTLEIAGMVNLVPLLRLGSVKRSAHGLNLIHLRQ